MTPTEALKDAIDDIECVIPEDADELIEALRVRGFQIVEIPRQIISFSQKTA